MKIELNSGGRRQVIEMGKISRDKATQYFAQSLEKGDELYKLFLAMGADPNINNKQAIKMAVETGDLDTVKFLKEHGGSFDGVDLTDAIRQGHINVVDYMFRNGAEFCQTYVKAAILSNNKEMVNKILRQNGANVTEENINVAIGTSAEILNTVLVYFTGDTKFLWQGLKEAIEKADVDMVQLLFESLTQSKSITGEEMFRIDYANLANNCNNAEELNSIIKLIKKYKAEILQMDYTIEEQEKIYQKATMETLTLLGIDKEFAKVRMLKMAIKARNRKLAAKLIEDEEVDISAIF